MSACFDPALCRAFLDGRALTSARLQYRLMTPDDAVALHGILADPQVSGRLRFAAQPYLLDHAIERCARAMQAAQDGRELIFGVRRRGGEALIGSFGLHSLPEAGQAETGYFFARAQWGQGYASEALATAMMLARDAFAIQKLIATTACDNRGSQIVLERAGFARDGEIACLMAQGDVRPSYLYSLNLQD